MPETVDVEKLKAKLAELETKIPASADQTAKLAEYAEQLWHWNLQLNLTRHTDLEKFVTRDVWDSWQLAQLLAADEEVLDLGSGGGVPGIVLAVLRPDLEVSLCESVGKKARALQDMVGRLGLNVPVHAGRAESVLDDLRFSTVVARAVGPMWKILHWLKPHWAMVDRLLIIKGPRWVDERGEARHRGYLADIELRKLAEYPMPGTTNQSVILQLRRKRP